tara:strand:+ start:735 stop:1286 length:552 start_codon:yes stop_codon:yes gene_type:complete
LRIALVLGGGACVWSDLEAALDLGQFDGVVTCNDVTAAYPGRIDACASLHSSSWGGWLAERERRGQPRPGVVFGHTGAKGARLTDQVDRFVDYRFPGQDRSGSSGLFALKVALVDLGFDRAVLCGVPMTSGQKHFFDAHDWAGAQAHRIGWQQALPHIVDRARSMSGFTRELLGEPTEEWLGA